MRLRPTLPASVAVSLMAATTVLVAPGEAVAAPGRTAETALPDGFAAIEVGPATERVFVSSPTSDAVTVLADNGAILSALIVPGAGDLLIDGSTVYVASTTGGRVDAFDTSTLSFLRSYGEGALLKPNSLAMAGGLLWTTTGPCASDIDLVSIDTATEEILTYPDIPGLYYCPHLFTVDVAGWIS